MKFAYIVALGLASWVAPAWVQAQDAPSFTMGSAVPTASGQRTIVLKADTRWVNVDQGEAVNFVSGGIEFGWRFDAYRARSFDLQRVAPVGAFIHPVTVYITARGGHPAR